MYTTKREWDIHIYVTSAEIQLYSVSLLGGQYSVLRGDDDDDIPPPVPPAYNPDGVQEYSVLKREGEVRHH